MFICFTSTQFGCGSNEFIRPENAHNFRNKNIIVTLHTGSKISFDHDRYTFGENSGGKYISGMGKTVPGLDSSQSTLKEETIYFQNIENIQIVDKMGSTEKSLNALVVGGTVLASAILIYFLLHNPYSF